MARNSVVLDFRRRRFVYRAGEPADCLYAIVHGRIKLCRIETETGREAVIDILPEGSLFGESALYSAAGQRADSAIAYENSRLLRIRSGISNGGWLRMTAFMITLSALSVNALITLNDALLTLHSTPFRRVWTAYLPIFPCVMGFPSLKAYSSIYLPHREIASIVGSTRESVTVRLNAMRREGTIAFVKRRILIKRPASL